MHDCLCDYIKESRSETCSGGSSSKLTTSQTEELIIHLESVTYDKVCSICEYGIKLHHLPSYSPDLNPIERLWKVMNEYVRNNLFFASPKEFKKDIMDFFTHKWKLIKNNTRPRINDNSQIITK